MFWKSLQSPLYIFFLRLSYILKNRYKGGGIIIIIIIVWLNFHLNTYKHEQIIYMCIHIWVNMFLRHIKYLTNFCRYIAYTVNRVVYLMADDHDDDDLDICLFKSTSICLYVHSYKHIDICPHNSLLLTHIH